MTEHFGIKEGIVSGVSPALGGLCDVGPPLRTCGGVGGQGGKPGKKGGG